MESRAYLARWWGEKIVRGGGSDLAPWFMVSKGLIHFGAVRTARKSEACARMTWPLGDSQPRVALAKKLAGLCKNVRLRVETSAAKGRVKF